MNDEHIQRNKPLNLPRRKLLQGAACVGIAGFAPAVFGKAASNNSELALSGKLISKIAHPVKTLILRNHSDTTMVIDHLSQGAFMFDGGIVDCNVACLNKSIEIPANQEIVIQFDRRLQNCLTHKVEEFSRIQSRVTRLSDGTRVVPFSGTLNRGVATLV